MPEEDRDSLLRGQPREASSSSSAVPQSNLSTHRKQAAALLTAVWDSGVACVCIAAVVFSLSAFFVKLMGDHMPVFQIVAFRSVSSLAVCALFARLNGISPLFGHRRNLRYLLARGMFGAAAMTCYYFSIKMLPLADAVTLFFLNPAVTAVAAWAIMREPLGLRGAAGVAVSVAGLLLLTRPPFLGFSSGSSGGEGGEEDSSGGGALHGDGGVGVVGVDGAGGGGGGGVGVDGWDAKRLLGTMFGVLSALLGAGAFISIRFIGKSEPALVVSVYFHVCAATSSALPLALGLPKHAVAPTGGQWGLLLGVAATSFWGQILIGRGFQLLAAARASAINFTQVVYSYVLGLLFLNESLTLSGGAGSALIAVGAVLVNLRQQRKQQQQGEREGEGEKEWLAKEQEPVVAAAVAGTAGPREAVATPGSDGGKAAAGTGDRKEVEVVVMGGPGRAATSGKERWEGEEASGAAAAAAAEEWREIAPRGAGWGERQRGETDWREGRQRLLPGPPRLEREQAVEVEAGGNTAAGRREGAEGAAASGRAWVAPGAAEETSALGAPPLQQQQQQQRQRLEHDQRMQHQEEQRDT